MQLTTVFAALVAAGASASPITARQLGIPIRGSVNLYSGTGCNAATLIQANVNITEGCTVIDETVGSVRYNGLTQPAIPPSDGYLWPRKFPLYPSSPSAFLSAAWADLNTQSTASLVTVVTSSAESWQAWFPTIAHPQRWEGTRWGPSEWF